MQRLARVHQRENRMRRSRCLGETAEDQLQLAGIGRDVADGEQPGRTGGTGGRIDGNMVALEVQPPLRRSARGFATARRTAAGRPLRAGVRLRPGRWRSPPPNWSTSIRLQAVQLKRNHHLDAARLRQRSHPVDALRCGAKLVATVDDRHLRRDFGQRQRPVDGGIAASRNDHAAAAEVVASGQPGTACHARAPAPRIARCRAAAGDSARKRRRRRRRSPLSPPRRRRRCSPPASRRLFPPTAVTCRPRWKTGLNGAACSKSFSTRSAARMRG